MCLFVRVYGPLAALEITVAIDLIFIPEMTWVRYKLLQGAEADRLLCWKRAVVMEMCGSMTLMLTSGGENLTTHSTAVYVFVQLGERHICVYCYIGANHASCTGHNSSITRL